MAFGICDNCTELDLKGLVTYKALRNDVLDRFSVRLGTAKDALTQRAAVRIRIACVVE
jgi:hypothetical protein